MYDFGVILLEIISGRTIDTKNDIDVSKDIVRVTYEKFFHVIKLKNYCVKTFSCCSYCS